MFTIELRVLDRKITLRRTNGFEHVHVVRANRGDDGY